MKKDNVTHFGGKPVADIPILVVSERTVNVGTGKITNGDGPLLDVVNMIVKPADKPDLALAVVLADKVTALAFLRVLTQCVFDTWPDLAQCDCGKDHTAGHPSHLPPPNDRATRRHHGVPRQRRRR